MHALRREEEGVSEFRRQQCVNCAFWKADSRWRNSDFRSAECRRHSPERVERHGLAAPKWPETEGVMWCGDWERYEAWDFYDPRFGESAPVADEAGKG